MIFRWFNGLFLLAFVLSAAVQYNDPDALPWIAIYLCAVALCALQFTAIHWAWFSPVLTSLCLVWGLALLPAIVGQVSLQDIVESVSMRTRAVEEAREIGGLWLVALWSGVIWFGEARARGRVWPRLG